MTECWAGKESYVVLLRPGGGAVSMAGVFILPATSEQIVKMILVITSRSFKTTLCGFKNEAGQK